jgi:hypothetical protein
MCRNRPSDALRVLAWLNVLLHVLALALAAVGMRPGSPLVSLPERLTYLGGAPAGWTLGWVCWMLCTLVLVAFLALLPGRLGGDTDLARLGVVIAVVGAGFDLFCDSVYILVLPMLASRQPTPESLFLTVEKVTGIGSLVIANGAYSVAILLVSAAMRAHKGVGALTVGLGCAVAACGFVLAAAGFTGSARHAQWATPPTIGLFCIWAVLVARGLPPESKPP